MGLSFNDVRQLMLARSAGASFDKVATIGRQSLYLHSREIVSLASEFSLAPSAGWLGGEFGGYADSFFLEAMGVSQLTAVDASDYEGAGLILDMNQPLPAEHVERFDAVVDGGSLEHIFNVPNALGNLMKMTRTGGNIFISTPANNLCGHGFYQFSPELMFRVFSDMHGFAIHEVLLFEFNFPSVEQGRARAVVRVADPDALGERVGLMSSRAAMMFVRAEKTRHLANPFSVPPQQSDYVTRWDEHRGRANAQELGSVGRVAAKLPGPVRATLRKHSQKRRFSLANRRFYRPSK